MCILWSKHGKRIEFANEFPFLFFSPSFVSTQKEKKEHKKIKPWTNLAKAHYDAEEGLRAIPEYAHRFLLSRTHPFSFCPVFVNFCVDRCRLFRRVLFLLYYLVFRLSFFDHRTCTDPVISDPSVRFCLFDLFFLSVLILSSSHKLVLFISFLSLFFFSTIQLLG